MNSLYLILNIGSIALPLLFSFHPRIKFHKLWKPFFIGTLIMMVIFITWDVFFTINGIWGFDERYLLGIHLLHLPIEEWLFFICIPYACVFTHYTITKSFPNFELSKRITKIVYYLVLGFLIFSIMVNLDKWYTLVNFLYLIILLIIVHTTASHLLSKFFLTFLIILIPFFLVNGILTGSFIESPIVWYNNEENMGIRMGTIPIEDAFYAFGMLLTVLFSIELIGKPAAKKI
jgi:lycopene cyclase domain-containing protein